MSTVAWRISVEYLKYREVLVSITNISVVYLYPPYKQSVVYHPLEQKIDINGQVWS